MLRYTFTHHDDGKQAIIMICLIVCGQEERGEEEDRRFMSAL